MQEKQDQKVVLVSLPNHINLEHEEHTKKKTKQNKTKTPDLPTQISYGYAIFAADLLSHSRSNDLHCYLGDMEKIIGSSLSFLTIHGTSDGVTCPTSSKLLYKKAASEDKSLKLYDGMYHSLIQGEPYKNVNLVLKDMREWIDERVKRYGSKNL